MKTVVLQSLKNQAVIADKCFVASGFFDRLKGLIGRRVLPEGEAMFFPACNDVHMWFMSIPIDVIFVRQTTDKRRFEVTSVRASARPWRLLPMRDSKAHHTFELPSGLASKLSILPGDILCID